MAFDAAKFRAHRRREVTLSDGTVCVLRPPSLERAARRDDLPAISEKLQHEIAELAPQVKSMSMAELRARSLHNASYGDLHNASRLAICDAVIEPLLFIMDRGKESPELTDADGQTVLARVWVGWLDDADADLLLTAIQQMLNLSAEEFNTVAPFPVPDATGDAGAALGDSAAEQPASTSTTASAGFDVSTVRGQLAEVRAGCGGSESEAGNDCRAENVGLELVQ